MSDRGFHHNVNDLTGKKFGAWLVTKRGEVINGATNAYWTCLCLCGNTSDVSGVSLTNGRSTRCRTCANRGDKRVR